MINEHKHKKKPLLSIGMPLYNAETYLAEALDSIIKQSFKDFELIISDNGSTDGTKKICEKYARKDKRIRYIRHEENIGAAKNFNYVVSLASGKYFKWASYDDNLDKNFLKECVKALEEDSSVVLCYPRSKIIDAKGKITQLYDGGLNLQSVKAHLRLKMFFDTYQGQYWCNPVFGLIRMDILKKTIMIGPFVSSDVVLLAELALHGRFIEVPKYLFYRRIHPSHSVQANPSAEKRLSWFDPSKSGTLILPIWKHLWEYFKAINRVRTGFFEKLFCYWELKKWCWRNKRGLCRETAKFFLWPFIKFFGIILKKK